MGSSFTNEAAPFIAEYAQRKRLAKLGFTSNISELDATKAEIFGIIDAELNRLELEDLRRKNGRR